MAKQLSAFGLTGVRSSEAFRVRAADERAQTMTEYAVLLTLITLAVILAVTTLSNSVASHITDLANLLK